MSEKDDSGVQVADATPTEDTKAGSPGSEGVDTHQKRIDELETELAAERQRKKQAIDDRSKVKKELDDIRRAEHSAKGDIESLRRSFDQEKNDWSKREVELLAQLRRVTVDKEIRDAARDFIADEVLDDFVVLNRDRFELGDDDRVHVKDEVISLKDWIKGYAAKKPPFAKNQRAQGNGVPSAPQANGASAGSLEELLKMNEQDRIRYLATHPDIRRKYSEYVQSKKF